MIIERGEKFGAWCGLAGVFLFGPTLLAADFLPLPPATLSTEQVVALYQGNAMGVRTAVIASLYVAGLFTAFIAALSAQMRRIPGARALSYIQMLCGLLGTVPFVLTALLWAAAAFRIDRAPETIVLLNDMAWFSFVMVAPPVMIQLIVIGIAIISDDGEKPVYPRWLAYLSFWTALSLIADPLACIFKTGPFAWNGLLVFWLPFG
ncbi:MAG: hypothetical protein EOP61_19350, partial [Sphingomonadales bacterium]